MDRKAWDIDRFNWPIRVTPHNEVRMCFVTDHDGHWYLISAGLRDMFNQLLEDIKDEDSPKWYLWEMNFANKRCLPPTAYEFLDPKEL